MWCRIQDLMHRKTPPALNTTESRLWRVQLLWDGRCHRNAECRLQCGTAENVRKSRIMLWMALIFAKCMTQFINLKQSWSSESSGMYCRVLICISTDVSEVFAASMIRAIRGSTHLWNVGWNPFKNTAIRLKRLWASYSPPWELEISKRTKLSPRQRNSHFNSTDDIGVVSCCEKIDSA
jgi:hypothetical protein